MKHKNAEEVLRRAWARIADKCLIENGMDADRAKEAFLQELRDSGLLEIFIIAVREDLLEEGKRPLGEE